MKMKKLFFILVIVLCWNNYLFSQCDNRLKFLILIDEKLVPCNSISDCYFEYSDSNDVVKKIPFEYCYGITLSAKNFIKLKSTETVTISFTYTRFLEENRKEEIKYSATCSRYLFTNRAYFIAKITNTDRIPDGYFFDIETDHELGKSIQIEIAVKTQKKVRNGKKR